MSYRDLIARVTSGVAQILVQRDQETITNGTGFLVEGGLVTNSHVVRAPGSNVVAI